MRTPLAPAGCKVIVHESPEARETFAPHGKIGFYIEPSMDHYRNYRIYVKETGGIRNAATVEFFPQRVQMPKTSSADRLAATIEDLTHILKHPHPKTPFLDQGTPTNDAIRKLREIFHPPKSNVNASPRVRETDTLPRVARHVAPRVVKIERDFQRSQKNQHHIQSEQS